MKYEVSVRIITVALQYNFLNTPYLLNNNNNNDNNIIIVVVM